MGLRSKYHDAPIGQIYGYWTVVEYSHYSNEHYWVVKCACGRLEKRRASQLTLERSRSCMPCASKMRESLKSPFWKGYHEMSAQYLTRLKFRKREIPIEVHIEDLWKQWRFQEGKCAYTGIVLSLVKKDTGWSKSTASLDRKDSSKGYIKENIQWVHKAINRMKLDLPEEAFIKYCKLVAGHCGV